MCLQNHILNEILNRINQDERSIRQFESKWYRILDILYNTPPLSITRMVQLESIPKNLSISSTSLDIILSIYPEQPQVQISKLLIESLRCDFGEIARIYQDPSSIHIKFDNEYEIIVLVIKQQDFDSKYQNVQKITEIKRSNNNLVKLTKYALDQAGILNSIPNYKIEKLAISIDTTSIASAVEELLNKLKYDIKRINLSFHDVVKYLQ